MYYLENINENVTMNYDTKYFKNRQEGSARSAELVIPVIKSLLTTSSVLEVGCGTGSWLRVWKANGLSDVHGVDGEWVNKEQLEIDVDEFTSHDLTKPLDLKKKFDLVSSLEVAEHIEEKYADIFIESLIRHSETVLFSAAIPYQGGTDHFNEQWLDYWQAKFSDRGYTLLDPFRHILWNMNEVKIHYRQNTVLFVQNEKIKDSNFFATELEHSKRSLISVVHPKMFAQKTDPEYMSLKTFIIRNFKTLITLLKNYMNKFFKN